MKEEYKICPYCNNAVDKKDKQCPYCLKSLTRRNNPTIQTNNEPINSNNVDRDSWIKDNKEWNNFEIPPLFQKFLDTQKLNWLQKTNDPEEIKKIRKFFIIFFLAVRWIPFIIGIITSIFWD